MTENKPIMIDKKEKIEKEIKEMIPKLANIEFTKDDELEFCKKVLKDTRQQLARKTQECEELKSVLDSWMSKCERETRIKELYQDGLDQLKAENEIYKNMLDNPEVHVALTDVRTGERDLWQKYKPRMEQAEQKLERIRKYFKNKDISQTSLFNINYIEQDILQIIDEVER